MKNKFFYCYYLSIVVFFAVAAINVYSITNYVWNGGTHIPPFSSWTTAATNIESAVSAAVSGNIVLVTNGEYRLNAQIDVGSNIKIESVNGAEETIINGNFPFSTNRCFYIHNSTAVVDGFTVLNGWAWNNRGGGILIGSDGGNVRNCVITANKGANGGGVCVEQKGNVSNCFIAYNRVSYNGGGVQQSFGGELIDSVIVSNSSSWGGGIYMYKGGVVKNCLISTNTAANGGGGVYLNTSALVEDSVISENVAVGARGGGAHTENGGTIKNCKIINNRSGVDSGGIHCHINGDFENCVITGNYATIYGGGIYFYQGGTAIYCHVTENCAGVSGGGLYCRSGGITENSLIAKNTAMTNGGGAFVSGNCVIRNSLFSENSAVDTGGGLYLRNGAEVESCTIAENTARSGGGVACLSNTLVRNTIIYKNTASEGEDYLTLYSNCAAVFVCAGVLIEGAGNITNEPKFQCLSTRNYRLFTNSPCINAGTNLTWMFGAKDIDGGQRIIEGRVDIGAFEYNSTTSAYICVNNKTVYFNNILLFTTGLESVVVQNVGNSLLTGEVINISGPFNVISDNFYALESSEQTNITFGFSPNEEGIFSNTVKFTGGGGEEVLLIGTAIPEPIINIIYVVIYACVLKKVQGNIHKRNN